MKRVLAFAAAVAMIAGAWAIRDARRPDREQPSRSEVRLLCAVDLAEACEQLAGSVQEPELELSIEAPGVTADRLATLPAGDDPGFDVWLTAGPWGAMIADDRDFSDIPGTVLGKPSPVLATSDAVIVIRADLQPTVESSCGGTITWRCVGDQADALQVGLSPPVRADGLILLAEATAGYFGTTDYSAGDFTEPSFTQWFNRLLERSRTTRFGGRSALATAATKTGTFNIVGALESDADELLRERDGWATIYPEPMSTAQVNLLPRTGLDIEALFQELLPATRSALKADGWRTTGKLDDNPPDSGLPSAGVLNALRDLW